MLSANHDDIIDHIMNVTDPDETSPLQEPMLLVHTWTWGCCGSPLNWNRLPLARIPCHYTLIDAELHLTIWIFVDCIQNYKPFVTKLRPAGFCFSKDVF
jgi:hypothetical protein